MNILLFGTGELGPEQELVRVSGEQAKRLLAYQRIKVGSVIRVGEIGTRIGTGVVEEVGKRDVALRLILGPAPARRYPTDLIVGLCRPQIVKKVLQYAAMMGVWRVFVVASQNSEKSYFSSSVLDPERIRYELLLGLEQAVSVHLPTVHVFEKFRGFEQEYFATVVNEQKVIKLIAKVEAKDDLAKLSLRDALEVETTIAVAVGPEQGWTDEEINCFTKYGFVGFSIGEYVLRVELAVGSALGQLRLLRAQASLAKY